MQLAENPDCTDGKNVYTNTMLAWECNAIALLTQVLKSAMMWLFINSLNLSPYENVFHFKPSCLVCELQLGDRGKKQNTNLGLDSSNKAGVA